MWEKNSLVDFFFIIDKADVHIWFLLQIDIAFKCKMDYLFNDILISLNK